LKRFRFRIFLWVLAMNREANEKTPVTSEKENPFENWSSSVETATWKDIHRGNDTDAAQCGSLVFILRNDKGFRSPGKWEIGTSRFIDSKNDADWNIIWIDLKPNGTTAASSHGRNSPRI